MQIKTYSYRNAEEIMEHPRYKNAYEEIMRICRECPIPVYEGKSEKQKNKDVLQQIMNTYFKLRFVSLGWEEEPLATPDNNEDSLRSDFRKTFYDSESNEKLMTVQIEVEFGNTASSYRNYFKFQLSYSYDMAEICVLIVPSYDLANRIDTNVSNFEKIVREMPSAKLSITVPILVIGLFYSDEDGVLEEPWNVKEITQDLKVLKGSSKKVEEEHEIIVQSYIDKL